MAVILGRNLIVKVNGSAIAGAKSCEINIQSDDIEVASATEMQWREFVAGRKEWSVSCGHLIPASGTPLKSSSQMVGTNVTLTVESGLTGDTLTGSAIVKKWSASGPVGSLANGSFAFRGTGALA